MTFTVLIAGLAVADSVAWITQRQETIALQGELSMARQDTSELERLRAENQQLKEAQIPPAELERLRADHAALPRLRAESEALKKVSVGNGALH